MRRTIGSGNDMRWIKNNLNRMSHVLTVDGVKVYFHWSVFVIVAAIFLGEIQRPVPAAAGLLSYLGILLIHEFGHVVAARRRGCGAFGVYIWPIHGRAEFGQPWSRFDHAVIAWGGVLAQLAAAAPLILWVEFFGYTRFEAVNAVLGILGFYSVFVAAFNLLPFWNLDGTIAWQIVPAYFERVRARRVRRLAVGRFR